MIYSVDDGEVGLVGYRVYIRKIGADKGSWSPCYVPNSLLSWRRVDLEMEGTEVVWIGM